MVSGSGYGISGKATGKEAASGILLIVALIIGAYILLYYFAKKEIGNLGKELFSGLKEAIDTRTPDEKAQARYEIASSGPNSGMPITGVAPSPTILATMERYYDTDELKTSTNLYGQVWGIDAPSIDPSPISTETPSGYIHRREPGDVLETYYWVYGCDENGYNCRSSKKFGWADFTIGYRDLT